MSRFLCVIISNYFIGVDNMIDNIEIRGEDIAFGDSIVDNSTVGVL